jgi:selenocysteine-specific elongation factor
VRAKLGAADPLVDHAVSRRVRDGTLELDAALIRRAGFRPKLDDTQSARRAEILATLRAAGREPPSVPEMEAKLGKGLAPILRMLDREGLVVAVEADRYYAKEAVAALIAQLRADLSPGTIYPPSDLRTLLGVSRKYLIPLLEHFDRTGITRRHPDGRSLQ